MDDKTNNGNGLCDESLDKFGQFMKMVERTSYLSEIDVTCSICLDVMHQPHEIDPCNHRFCHSCLIRWCQAGWTSCPICRGAINGINLNVVLDELLETQRQEEFLRKYTLVFGKL